MKQNNLTFIAFAFLTFFLLLVSCVDPEDDEVIIIDPCAAVVCENDGVCVEGVCDCPEGFIGSSCESFDPTRVQFLLDAGRSPMSLLDDGILLDSLYGKMYEGGLIFYLNIEEGNGLVASPTDLAELAEWGCMYEELDGADGSEVGTGAQNTLDIIAGCGEEGIAAKVCDALVLNERSDWFLPSSGALNLIYMNLHLKEHSEFQELYWSSTESGFLFAFLQEFEDGIQFDAGKSAKASLRAVRAF